MTYIALWFAVSIPLGLIVGRVIGAMRDTWDD